MKVDNNTFPATGLVRIGQIVGDPKATPPIQPFINTGKSTWYALVQKGIAPRPVKLGPRMSLWDAEEIRAFADGLKKKRDFANSTENERG